MFKALFDIINRTKQLNVNKVAFFVFQNNEVQKIIIDLNRIDQLLYNGELPDGSLLPTYKRNYNNLATFEGKSVTKEQGQPYTLLDTGDFYRSFKVIVNSQGFEITANDEKENGTLEEMYAKGSKILGLTDESRVKLSNEIIPYIRNYLKNYLLQ